MAGVAPAYRSNAVVQRKPRTTQVSVVAGRRPDPVSPTAIRLAKLFVVFLCIAACVACVRIGLAAATVSTERATEDIAAQVEELKSQTASLQVRTSALSTPSYVKGKASGELGMAAAQSQAMLVMDPDVVCLDSEGNLSLSLSLASAARG